MKFRIVFNANEITVITQDGGIACIREADDIIPGEPRTAVTDYYQNRLTDVLQNEEGTLFDRLAEGKMYQKDWSNVEFNSLVAIQDALSWLCMGIKNWEICEDLFPLLFVKNKSFDKSIIPKDHLKIIADSSPIEILRMILESPDLLKNHFILNKIRSYEQLVNNQVT
jgi:hypothetical protein